MRVVAVPVLGIIFNILLQCIEANLTLDFKVTKISASHKVANCNVANTTYAHGETFKLDCKTQCVCENGRHACSSLCPKEQLPAPEDTISCRSPRLVEVPGHCCKMWLCENPTADVYATCHNSSTSPWTPCSRTCGLGISTRFTTTAAGCSQLSNLRLCENRKCEIQRQDELAMKMVAGRRKEKHLMKTKQLKHKLKRQHQQQKYYFGNTQQPQVPHEHRIRKGHECRSLQRLGPARIRLGQCVSRKLYRPKICGHCHKNSKCCVPSVSTTIQVELLCPLNAMDPINFVQQQLNAKQQKQFETFYPKASVSSNSPLALASLWDTHSLDAIDQEYLQSHQVQIANKFIAVEWILKCECTKNDNCQRIVNATTAKREGTSNSNDNSNSNSRRLKNSDSSVNDHRYHEYAGNENVDMEKRVNSNNNNNEYMPNINSFKFNRNNNYNNNMKYINTQIEKIRDDNNSVNENADGHEERDEDADARETDADNDRDININRYTNTHVNRFNHKKQTKDYDENAKSNNNENMINNQNNVKNADNDNDENKDENEDENEDEIEDEEAYGSVDMEQNGTANSLLSSDEIQPDIIPYPPPPFSANEHTGNGNNIHTKNNNNKNTPKNWIKQNFNAEYRKRNKQQQQHSKQQKQKQGQQQHYYEHWLLQQYNNHQPYQREDFST